MFRLPLLFIVTGAASFILFHLLSLLSFGAWIVEPPRNPDGWFRIHLLVLDWGTMVAMGAVYQLIDVVLQRRIYSKMLGYIHYGVFTAGSFILLAGFYFAKPPVIAAGATFALLGVLLFVWNVGVTLLQAKQWNAVTLSTAFALVYLALTALIGTVMGLNFVFSLWWEGHNRLLAAHIWLGTLGWFGLLITGFSYKMLPMFYLSHGARVRAQKAVLLLWNSAVITGAASFMAGGGPGFDGLALLLLLGALIAYNVHIADIRKHRHKGSPGQGIWWTTVCAQALAAYVLLLLVIWAVNPSGLWSSEVVLLSGWMYLWGWVAMTILGYLSKIVPFLWWTYKYGPHAGKSNVPVMSALIGERSVHIGMAGIAAGLVVVLAGIAVHFDSMVWVGSSLLSLFSLYYMTLIVRVFTR